MHTLGTSPAECARLLAVIDHTPASWQPLLEWKEAWSSAASPATEETFEQFFLKTASRDYIGRVDTLPLHASVKKLLLEEFHYYTRPGAAHISLGTPAFCTACKVLSLRRFPAGPMDWEIGGFPRSWLSRLALQDVPRLLWFITRKFGGFGPAFFMHVARRPKNRSLVVEREVLRSYYRMALCLKLQPEIKGILASSWFHDPAALAEHPHLAALNKPYLEDGGLIVMTGLADADAGFLENNEARRSQLEKGLFHCRIGTALWPRTAALNWAERHPELEK